MKREGSDDGAGAAADRVPGGTPPAEHCATSARSVVDAPNCPGLVSDHFDAVELDRATRRTQWPSRPLVDPTSCGGKVSGSLAIQSKGGGCRIRGTGRRPPEQSVRRTLRLFRFVDELLELGERLRFEAGFDDAAVRVEEHPVGIGLVVPGSLTVGVVDTL